MELRIIEEAGHHAAIGGMKFSHQTECNLWEIVDIAYTTDRAKKLAKLDNGHNKFLESIMVWMDIRAPFYWWKQMDTYRIGVTKQSKSTMHSITKRKLTKDDFTDPEKLYADTIELLNWDISLNNFDNVIKNLPDSYLQTRRLCLSYKTIRHILKQRQHHKLGEWREFCDFVKDMLMYPELLGDDIV